MYGTIFNLKVRANHEDALLQVFNEDQAKPEGSVAWFVMNPDSSDTWIGVAVFESQEAHRTNAESPQQHATFLKMMEHLESEPEWTDGTFLIGQIS
jgi:quinol monooxygenase YgiN